MPYRTDTDLHFLGEMSDEALHDLVEAVTKDKDGKAWISEELTGKAIYKENYPKHSKYWTEIAAEIQCFGANSIATLFRGGQGVLYREILEDVCDKCKVTQNEKQNVGFIEEQLLIKLLGEALEEMSEEDREKFAKIAGLNEATILTPAGLMLAARNAFLAGGFQSYRLAFLIANYVSRILLGRGLTFAATATLSRTIGVIAGPIGLTVTGVWTAIDLASPAFRVTLPAVVHVAMLRKQHQAEREGILKAFEDELNR